VGVLGRAGSAAALAAQDASERDGRKQRDGHAARSRVAAAGGPLLISSPCGAGTRGRYSCHPH
jgi:hypothetical protein